MTMKKGFRALVDLAMSEVRTLSVDEARALLDDPNVQFVDVRDIRELEREGVIPHALHAPRGMLEFWVDPESPYHKPAFAQDKTFVFFCAAGWRSALATKTVQDMGLERVAHIEGGFTAWKAAGAPVAAYEKPTKNA
ncbi:rhodanese-like domain-containing protein [Ralstonia sp. UBA689]|uniref:rhodanese-like domain-containing protein n=1 Tax=Ralstonia sp. UBA689 TaxID=1947373 RepID=UPI0025F6AC6F|nr:rhodanese-like domain-containing protein [Ralstonia sp. UBA689]